MRRLYLFASLILLTGETVFAQAPMSPWRPYIQGGGVHQFDTDLDGGGSISASRGFIEGGVNYAFSRRERVGVALAYEYDGYDFDGNEGLAGLEPWDSVGSLRLAVPIGFGIGERFDVVAVPSVRWSAETSAPFEDSMTGGLLTGFTYRVNDRLKIGPGLGVFSEIEDNALIFPILVIDWQITDAFAIETGEGFGATRGPGLFVNYTGVEDWRFVVGARYDRRRFRLDDGAVPGGIGEEQAFPAYLTAAYEGLPNVELALVGGVEFAGSLSLEDENGDEVVEEDFDPAPFLGLAFRARF